MQYSGIAVNLLWRYDGSYCHKVIKPDSAIYKVKISDTLSGIAEKFDGATVASIKKTNKITKAALQPGVVLKIKS